MEQSILNSTKKVLGLVPEYTAFDEDILVHINSTFSVLHELGLGPEETIIVEDADAVWGDLVLTTRELNLVKTYVYLKVRMLFDPPTLSYLIDAMNKQIVEYEWRLTNFRESTPDTSYVVATPDPEVVL
jgi:hypothetical protein